jgi:hypothetical protein
METTFTFGLGVGLRRRLRVLQNILMLWSLLVPMASFYPNRRAARSTCPGLRCRRSSQHCCSGVNGVCTCSLVSLLAGSLAAVTGLSPARTRSPVGRER